MRQYQEHGLEAQAQLSSQRMKCNMVPHFLNHNSTEFSMLQCYTLKKKNHVFSHLQSMYLNFSATKGQVQLQTQDFVVPLGRNLSLHVLEMQVLPEGPIDAERVAESNPTCSNTCNKST